MDDGTGRSYSGDIRGGDDPDPNKSTEAVVARQTSAVPPSEIVFEGEASDLAGYLPSIDISMEIGDVKIGEGTEWSGVRVRWRIGPARS